MLCPATYMSGQVFRLDMSWLPIYIMTHVDGAILTYRSIGIRAYSEKY